jgi:hypothetical protein
MRGSTFRADLDGITYLVDNPVEDNGVKATVTAISQEKIEAGTVDHILHRDRFNLDVAKAREKFAEIIGTDPAHLNTLRDQILDFITPGASPGEEMPEPADPEIVKQAKTLLADPDLLTKLGTAVRAGGYAGDLHNPTLLYLALTSRVTNRPINVLVGGPSSAGKNFLVDTVVAFFPAAAVYVVGAMSERALVYTDADFQHRHVVISEAAAIHRDGTGALIMRCLIWGNQLEYEVTEQAPDGEFGTRRITKPGPSGLITTSVKGIEEELNTRLLTLTVPDDEAATRDILATTGKRAAGEGDAAPDLRVWLESQRWLAEVGTHEVVIPFAKDLSALYPTKLIRARRDFPQLLALIEASAILHQQQRERDEQGRIIATEADYRIVYELAAPVFGAAAVGGVTPAVRATIAKVEELTAGKEGVTASAHAVAEALGIERSALTYRLKRAFTGGYLVNEEPIRGKPYKLRVGDPLPDEATLPSPETLCAITATSEPIATGEHPRGNPRGSAETTVQLGDVKRGTVHIEHAHSSNGQIEQSSPHHDEEIAELLNSSPGFWEERHVVHADGSEEGDL